MAGIAAEIEQRGRRGFEEDREQFARMTADLAAQGIRHCECGQVIRNARQQQALLPGEPELGIGVSAGRTIQRTCTSFTTRP